MAVYKYKARDITGKAILGTVEASNLEVACGQIENLGYIPISIKEQTLQTSASFDPGAFFGNNVKPKDLITFTFQISTLIGAGIPLLTGLKSLAKQTRNRKLKNVLEQASVEVEGGSTLFESLAKHPNVFPEIYVNMIRAGEASGKLQEIFIRLGEMIEHESDTREQIDAALRYPKLVVIALGLAFFIVVTFVVPRFVAIFSQFKIALPLPTKILIGLNSLISDYWAFLLVAVALSSFFLSWFIKTREGRYYWHYIKLKAPVLGPLFLKVALSRFAYMMGILHRSGIPIIENLHITSLSIGNDVITEAIEKLRESVQEGKGLAGPMVNLNIFSPLIAQMVSVGESSGELDDALLKVSSYYDMEVNYDTKHLATYLEPILTLMIGSFVLFFALAILLPMWDLTKIAGR